MTSRTSSPTSHPAQADRTPRPPFPAQHQDHPGRERDLRPEPRYTAPDYRPAGKLTGKVALITGGDSGIGRAVALLYAREGADVAICFLPEEQEDASVVRAAVEEQGRRCLLLPGDLAHEQACRAAVERTWSEFGRLDILVANAAHQNRTPQIGELSDQEFDLTFRTNVYGFFRLAKAAVPRLARGASIIATASIQGLDPSQDLLDYAASKAAIISLVKSLARQLASQGIRVNAVAPGPVWTPLNAVDHGATPERVAHFGEKSPAGRPAQPEEISPAYVFLASEADSSFISGEVIVQTMGE